MADEGTELVEAYDYLFKFIVIAATGKSCLLYQFINEAFKEHSAHTIGVEFSSRTVRIGERNIKLQVPGVFALSWRSHGPAAWTHRRQERFRSVTRSYYRAILVYDITSFANLDRWVADCRAVASPHVAIVLVGNKLDREDEREVMYEEGERWAREHGLTFLETSSRSGENTQAAFLTAARHVLAAIDTGELDPNASGTGVSYGERQLRAVASEMRLGSVWRRGAPAKRRERDVDLRSMVSANKGCAC